MRSRWIAAVAAGASVVLLAGCGGDDEAPIEPIGETTTDTPAPTALSKRQFITSADSRCAEANVAIANISSAEGAGLSAAAGQEQEITKGVLQGLQALNPPSDATGALDRFFDALQEQVNILRNRQRAAASGDTERYNLLGDELAQAKADARLAGEEYGFTECGQEASALETPSDTDSGATGGSVPAPAPAPAPAPPATGGTGSGGGSGGSGGDSGGSSGGISPG